MSADTERRPLGEPFVGLRFTEEGGRYVWRVESVEPDGSGPGIRYSFVALDDSNERGEYRCTHGEWAYLRAQKDYYVLIDMPRAVSYVSLPNGSDGLPCAGALCAGQVHPYVEPNQPDGLSYLCPSCR